MMDANCSGGKTSQLKNLILISDSAIVDGGAAKVALQTAKIMNTCDINVTFFSGGQEFDKSYFSDADMDVCLFKKCSLRSGDRSLGNALKGIWDRDVYRVLRKLLAGFNASDTLVHVHSWASVLSPSIFGAICDSGLSCVITAHDYCMACPNCCFFDFQKGEICCCKGASTACLIRNCDKDSVAVKAFRLLRFARQSRVLQKLKPHIVCVSEYQRTRLDNVLPFSNTCSVVMNPVEIANSCSNAKKSLSKEDMPFLYVGRISEEKGCDLFCEACTRLGVNGIVVGGGAIEGELRERYPLLDFRGWLKSEDVAEVFFEARALVFPSRWYEALPLTPLEAQLSACLPCIVSDSSAAADFAENGKLGAIFKSGDVESLVSAMSKMMDDARCERMCAEIKSRHIANTNLYSIERYMSNMLEVYAQLMKDS